MQFGMKNILGVAFIGITYLSVFVTLWKSQIKQVYSRRLRREKIFTGIGIIFAFIMMLVLVAWNNSELLTGGYVTNKVNEVLFGCFNGNIRIVEFVIYCICALPVCILSAAIIDEIGQHKIICSIPFHIYIVLFLVQKNIYRPLDTGVSAWFETLLLVCLGYISVKMYFEGRTRKQCIYVIGILSILIMFVCFDGMTSMRQMAEYIVVFFFILLLSILINRTSVLKKYIWYVVIVLNFGLSFLGGIIIG